MKERGALSALHIKQPVVLDSGYPRWHNENSMTIPSATPGGADENSGELWLCRAKEVGAALVNQTFE
eukprot:9733712-Karenia_brevis.AAC.1